MDTYYFLLLILDTQTTRPTTMVDLAKYKGSRFSWDKKAVAYLSENIFAVFDSEDVVGTDASFSSPCLER